jgi:hypothetical protein
MFPDFESSELLLVGIGDGQDIFDHMLDPAFIRPAASDPIENLGKERETSSFCPNSMYFAAFNARMKSASRMPCKKAVPSLGGNSSRVRNKA